MERREYKEEKEMPEFAHGYESTVHKYISDDGEEVVLKKFREKKDIDETKRIARNKEQKLEILSSLNIPYFVQIKDLLFKNGILVGYTMPMVVGKQLDLFSKTEDKLKELHEIRKIMLELNSKGIYIGDYAEHNFFLLDDGTVICLDLDNYRIYSYGVKLDFDTLDLRSISRFNQKCKKDELIDRYCYNAQIICLLGRYDLSKTNFWYMNKLPKGVINSEYNWDTINEMLLLGDNYQGNLLEIKRRN
ncbi:MAG: hypothetical protein IKZ96_02255 [Bacilli bacterium]|nr:hypothetical protein [Bacilli bacterium]